MHRTVMTSERSGRAASVLGMATLLCVSAVAADPPPQVTHDGLHLVPDSEMAVAWAKPEADFTLYQRLMILDPYVAFRKNWQAEKNRSSVYRISNRDMDRIKADVAELFRETFVEELDAKGGYSVLDAADTADTDVLLIRPAIIDLEINAPDTPTPGRSYSFVSSAGAATLYVELYDSVSGEILARAVDRQATSDLGRLRWSNSVMNRTEGKKLIAGWARLLRERLDAIHTAEKDEPR